MSDTVIVESDVQVLTVSETEIEVLSMEFGAPRDRISLGNYRLQYNRETNTLDIFYILGG